MLEVDIRHRQGSFTLEARFRAGQGLTALFGPSGSGKTSIIHMVAGLEKPGAGTIRFGDTTWSDSEGGLFVPAHRRRIGYVFQEGRLFPHLSVRQNLAYGTRFIRGMADRRAENLARISDLLGITPLLDRRPQSLSGGEKQRVALGRALMSEPQLLLMDEPLSALDDQLKADILPDLERIRDVENIPILYVSHSVAEIARLATRVIALERGRIVGSAPGMAHGDSEGGASGMAGSFLHAAVIAQLPEDELTVAQSPAGTLYLRHVDVAGGTRLRVHIPAGDVVLATGTVTGLSSLNRLSGTIEAMRDDGASVEVTVSCSGERVLARITRLSARSLGLAPGHPVQVLFKALSIAPEGMFRGGDT